MESLWSDCKNSSKESVAACRDDLFAFLPARELTYSALFPIRGAQHMYVNRGLPLSETVQG